MEYLFYHSEKLYGSEMRNCCESKKRHFHHQNQKKKREKKIEQLLFFTLYNTNISIFLG